MNKRNNQEAKQRAEERRRREDEAPRLIREVGRLASLDIEVDNGGNRYTWRIVVDRAPALVELGCPGEACTSGGHDLTRAVMQRLRASTVPWRLDEQDVNALKLQWTRAALQDAQAIEQRLRDDAAH